MAQVVEQIQYILSEMDSNANKFWRATLYDDDMVRTEWGRVGYGAQSKDFPGKGRAFFDQKAREKRAKGYTPVKVIGNTQVVTAGSHQLAQVATEQIAATNPVVAALIARLARENVHNILNSTTMQYDASKGTFSTPLGIVTAEGIIEARDLLANISQYAHFQQWDVVQMHNLVDQYLRVVPQHIGMKRLDVRDFFGSQERIQKQLDIVDSLEASLQNALHSDVTKDSAAQPKVFEVKVWLEEDGLEIDRVRKFYRSTNQSMHSCSHLDVKTVYRVELAQMHSEFVSDGSRVGNVMELWHGTKTANILSILKSGLKTAPPATAKIAGKAFGNGIYLSDQSTKALNYAYGYWTGGRDNNAMMFLANVAMGKMYIPKSSSETFPKAGYDGTFAKAGVSGVYNNEFIVYKNSQVDLTHLVEFSPNGK